MNFQIISFHHTDIKLFQQALFIREKVFVIEQGVDKSIEYSGDAEATHYLLLDDRNPIGTARWRKTGKGIKLERFAVLADFRNKGTGKIILDKILLDVKPQGQVVYLHAQEGAVKFYLKNGFQIVGEMFMEAGIKHYKMILG